MSRAIRVGDLLDDPEFVSRMRSWRVRSGLRMEADWRAEFGDQSADLNLGYFCVRCVHRHFKWTAIGKRHSGPQPQPLERSDDWPLGPSVIRS